MKVNCERGRWARGGRSAKGGGRQVGHRRGYIEDRWVSGEPQEGVGRWGPLGASHWRGWAIGRRVNGEPQEGFGRREEGKPQGRGRQVSGKPQEWVDRWGASRRRRPGRRGNGGNGGRGGSKSFWSSQITLKQFGTSETGVFWIGVIWTSPILARFGSPQV